MSQSPATDTNDEAQIVVTTTPTGGVILNVPANAELTADQTQELATLLASHASGSISYWPHPPVPGKEGDDNGARVITNATLDDVRPGDHLTWERRATWRGVDTVKRREGTAHFRVPVTGDWQTEDGEWITNGEGEGITLTIRRPSRGLSTVDQARIVPAPGHKTIVATLGGGRKFATTLAVYNARRDYWVADWREVESNGGEVMQTMPADKIDPSTCQEDHA